MMIANGVPTEDDEESVLFLQNLPNEVSTLREMLLCEQKLRLEAEAAFQQSHQSLEMKRMFVRYVSHEVRTPLNTVSMGLMLLRQSIEQKMIELSIAAPALGSVSEDLSYQLEMVDDIKESCNVAIGTVNDLLLYEKLEGGILQLEKRKEDALKTVLAGVKPFVIQAKQSSIDLQFTYDSDSSSLSLNELDQPTVFFDIDKPKISQVIRNLVSNAIKFTLGYMKQVATSMSDQQQQIDSTVTEDNMQLLAGRCGAKKSVAVVSVHVSIFSKRTSESIATTGAETADLSDSSCVVLPPLDEETVPTSCNEDHVRFMRITVKDSGPGLSAENQEKLFKTIVQFNANTLQDCGGSGLGLFISKGIMDLHGGVIGVRSEGEGKGAEFYIDLPVLSVEEQTSSHNHRDHQNHSFTAANRASPSSAVVISKDDEGGTGRVVSVSLRKSSAKNGSGGLLSPSSSVEQETTAGRRRTFSDGAIVTDFEGRSPSFGAPAVFPSSPGSPVRPRSFLVSVWSPPVSSASGSSCFSSCEYETNHHNRPARRKSLSSFHSTGTKKEDYAVRIERTPSSSVSRSVNNTGNTAGTVGTAVVRSDRGGGRPPPTSQQVLSALSPILSREVSSAKLRPSPTNNNFRVLVVDDSATNRKMASRLISMKKLCDGAPDEASDGQEAVDMVIRSLSSNSAVPPYAAVLMDCVMPVMDGLTATQRIREAGYTGLIVGVTGNVQDEDIDHFISCGADFVMGKPLDTEKLVELLQNAIKKQREEKEKKNSPTVEAIVDELHDNDDGDDRSEDLLLPGGPAAANSDKGSPVGEGPPFIGRSNDHFEFEREEKVDVAEDDRGLRRPSLPPLDVDDSWEELPHSKTAAEGNHAEGGVDSRVDRLLPLRLPLRGEVGFTVPPRKPPLLLSNLADGVFTRAPSRDDIPRRSSRHQPQKRSPSDAGNHSPLPSLSSTRLYSIFKGFFSRLHFRPTSMTIGSSPNTVVEEINQHDVSIPVPPHVHSLQQQKQRGTPLSSANTSLRRIFPALTIVRQGDPVVAAGVASPFPPRTTAATFPAAGIEELVKSPLPLSRRASSSAGSNKDSSQHSNSSGMLGMYLGGAYIFGGVKVLSRPLTPHPELAELPEDEKVSSAANAHLLREESVSSSTPLTGPPPTYKNRGELFPLAATASSQQESNFTVGNRHGKKFSPRSSRFFASSPLFFRSVHPDRLVDGEPQPTAADVPNNTAGWPTRPPALAPTRGVATSTASPAPLPPRSRTLRQYGQSKKRREVRAADSDRSSRSGDLFLPDVLCVAL